MSTASSVPVSTVPTSVASAVTVDVVIPVYNEERDLEPSVTKLRAFLRDNCPYRWRIMIADNASKDRTLEIARSLAERFPAEVTYIHLDAKGRGRALKAAWTTSDADIVSYMDVDLSTNLRHFMPLIEPLARGAYHVATGSRLMAGARVTRQLKREIISRCYNLIVKLMFPRRRFSDAQCGFKALTRQAVRDLIPHIVDNNWFFDSELLIRAEQRGYRVWEVPVEWIEDLDSRVKIIPTAIEDLKGLWRVRTTKLDN
ncbi:MAG: glycosyltransferase family 2 protein [Anaerolineae bacterium]|nr:glycosyltransferase family 2 protein [Thermoflexales bacterium]MDW8406343.1 glycosyltransferase family 2 protein [Anaerolineae bacterium]